MRARSRALVAGALLAAFAGHLAGAAQDAADTQPPGRAAASEETSEPAAPIRRIPGRSPPVPVEDERLPPPLPVTEYESVAVPDRWRIVEALGVNESVWNPYRQSTLKADRPLPGTQDWFLNLMAVSDSLVEPRRLPTPVGIQASNKRGSLDLFGDDEQVLFNENLIVSASLIQGDTVFRPPDYEFRFTGVWNWNYTVVDTFGVVKADPGLGRRRYDNHFAIQELFVDKHLRNRSDRYDFDSLRVGIQPFISDFRGFLFQDQQLGARLFGTFRNNQLQYNLAWFHRIEKDTNSGLNTVFDLRSDDVFVANAYYQDFPVLGFTLQGTAIYNRNREGGRRFHFNDNGFLERPASIGDERPHDYDVVYLGLNGDGHFDRLNLTFSAYWAVGEDDRHPIPQRSVDIDAWFLAAEASVDFDWWRLKAYGLYASGDDDPFDGEARGFDAIFENPQFAGADTSFWQRQAIPFIGGGGVILSGRNALLPALRSSKEEGQSNFINPGLGMLGIGADFDLLPELRLIVNASHLDFANTSVLRALRVQGDIDNDIGFDLSAGIIYRPLFINNVIFRLSGAMLVPGKGMRQLFDDDERPFYSVLANLILTY